ncbi:MAG: mannitol dehydrogenase family protein [Alphaproteobacteria bacterium]|nr:mannitol dehydrogenase family protein [Alphaproteobacteria bacterium]MBU1281136.1 mannitol dehydrogenase family protein [Alphaproteobacteria bacterium]MBU1573678.1 mannitol dehydrogenase family protein [Alphaproteobacteria bacterium]MBU2079420.1 mannitol dehydrogenase family protein [Alphaproteobacteria bacterium]MBU2161819.1 mannitol dehydrogenase family protein [Alphaproteobacteria bacterium]
MTPTPVVQFGTSRFLQAHADLFLAEGSPARTITVVQTSGSSARAGRLAAFTAPGGYPVRIRGQQGGQIIDEERRVSAVTRTLSSATDWQELSRVISEEAQFILSNTSDAGFDPQPDDTTPRPMQSQSYPAKLYHLLAARHMSGGAPLSIFPMELIPENGSVLRARVLEIAAANGASADLTGWLGRCLWANSLVDRIVSEPIEPVGAVAEPYALWAIEAQPGLVPPTDHPSIKMVPSLETIERLKLHILNLGHTAMAAFWMQEDGPVTASDALVRDLLAGPMGTRVTQLMQDEVLPGFAVHGMGAAAQAYLTTTLERFANPFLDHRIADIAQNHAQKLDRRIGTFLTWVRAVAPNYSAPVLDGLMGASAPAASTPKSSAQKEM